MPDPLYRNTSREYPGFNMNIPDQFRADQFIREMETKYVKGGADLPQFLFIHLPNDHMTQRAAGGRISVRGVVHRRQRLRAGPHRRIPVAARKWWKEMAVFVTEDDAQGGVDHIDAHRTVAMASGRGSSENYVSHVNTSFPGLLKTDFPAAAPAAVESVTTPRRRI